MQLVILATCNLNQWALDFVGNRDRIIESIRQAKAKGAALRVGPELEVTGYGCLDHFAELDLTDHSWESLSEIISHEDCQDILLDLGAPIRHRNVLYNCRILCHNKQILLIRPKLSLAQDGNYREMRYFTPWKGVRVVEKHTHLPQCIQKLTGQDNCPIGDAVISTLDTCFGAETCEEMFTPRSPHISLSLDGVEILTNSSGSHHELRKLDTRIDLIKSATAKCGGIYLYANQRGCDGDRLYYDGCSMIIVNGKIVAQASQFSLKDVEVITAVVDLDEVRSYRQAKSRAMQARETLGYQRIEVNIALSTRPKEFDFRVSPSKCFEPLYYKAEDEIMLGPACFLWDFLRRSRQAGFFLPLSGGIDSCATACIVFSMCKLVFAEIQEGNCQALRDLLQIVGEDASSLWRPQTPENIARRLFVSAYMGMAKNSSSDTRNRARELAGKIGSYHLNFDIDTVVNAILTLFAAVTRVMPRYKTDRGSVVQNLAIQNIQARVRMVLSYLFAQLVPSICLGRTISGSLLVLSSANVDESLRGYFTKYDCSSADINPIGSISKKDLKRFILHAVEKWDMPLLMDFVTAPPTAELEPITEDYVQSDEVDMGMSYDELSVFGRLRKVEKLGAYGMFAKLLYLWGDELSPHEIAEKVKRFFWFYSINRHKMTTLTPSVHMEAYSPDDNRFDLRPFLYPPFTAAYKKIEAAVSAMGAAGSRRPVQEEKKNT
jgi:NAD+ synthase (glutamine-hydrolysing)